MSSLSKLKIPNQVLLLLVGILTLALAVSLLLNYGLFKRAEQYYWQLNQTRLDPLGLQAYSSTTRPSTSKPRVLFFGDSRAKAWPEPADLPQFEFVNRGIGAQTSSQVMARFENHAQPLQPDVVIFQMCINDLKTIPLFPERKRWIIDLCKENLAEAVRKTRLMGATVIVTTVFPLGRIPFERRLYWSTEVDEAIAEVNSYLHTLADEDVIVWDTDRLLADEDGLVREPYSRDFLHLNEAGYEALNEVLGPLLLTWETKRNEGG